MVQPGQLNTNVANSLALYTYVARSIDLCKVQFLEFWLFTLSQIIKNVMPHVDAALSRIKLGDDDQHITLGSDGQVRGINDLMANAVSVENQNVIKADA